MSPGPSTEPVPLLHALLDMTNRVGPLTLRQHQDPPDLATSRRYPIALLDEHDEIVALVRTDELAAWLVEGPRRMRGLVEVLSFEWAAHEPVDNRCRECDRTVSDNEPCPARQRIANMLVRAARSDQPRGAA